MTFTNSYEDAARAEAYARLEFANTYYLAYRDLPKIIGTHVTGIRALDFGCGTGRSTRFARRLGFDVVGVDIAPEMIRIAERMDPGGDYRLTRDDDFSEFGPGTCDLVLSVFPFDNIAGFDAKVRLFRNLGALLNASGKIVNVVSSPEIYVHEWASFSTKDYPENRVARSGDTVRCLTTEFNAWRPVEDVLWTDASYREVYARAGLTVVEMDKPLATGHEPYKWVNETRIAPWVIYVLARESAAD